MPLFHEKAATAAMVKHGMTVQKEAIHFLNSGQIPVTVLDAPLFALAKLVQWKWLETHNERRYFVMMSELYIEMAMGSTFGDYLEGSGWTAALTQAGVVSSGTADSFLKRLTLQKQDMPIKSVLYSFGQTPKIGLCKRRHFNVPRGLERHYEDY